MNPFKFNCSRCGRRLKVDATICGGQIRCPACQEVIHVPKARTPSTSDEPGNPLASDAPGDPNQRTLDAQQARTTVFWRRKEPPTSSESPGGSDQVKGGE